MAFLAAIEVDQRQKLITSTDKLKEMLGGSWTIEAMPEVVKPLLDKAAREGDLQVITSLSGELWLRSTDLAHLEKTVWSLREALVNEEQLPCSFAIVEEAEDAAVKDIRGILEAEVKRIKDGKTGEMAFSALPWFAPCLIQPDQFANQWYPKQVSKRRDLLSDASSRRSAVGDQALSHYRDLLPDCGYANFANDLDDFQCGDENSFIGIIRLDADRSGSIFRESDWKSWEQMTAASNALVRCLDESLRKAILDSVPSAPRISDVFPISPLIRAGEDFLIVSRRDVAIPLTLQLMENYEKAANDDEDLKCVRNSTRLTLSGSILFARRAFPFSVLDELSRDLEHSAKEFRKSIQGDSQGCVDVYWLDSSAREDPIDQRNKSSRYAYGGALHHRFSSPWTLGQLKAIWNAVNLLAKAKEGARIPRGKWHEILGTLRFGAPVSQFAWRVWRSGLNDDQRKLIDNVSEGLKEVGLWPTDEAQAPWIRKMFVQENAFVTVLYDLHRALEAITGIDELEQ